MPILDAVFVGKIYLPEIWGGPIIPPSQPQPPIGAHPEHPIYTPPGIWGPPGPWPTPPIAYPPSVWPQPTPPHPAHPIVLPPEGVTPPDQPPYPPTNPSNPNWQWGWNMSQGWHPVYCPGVGDKPQPVPPPG